eukprot:CAMPEP_0174256758 /NCGR_PEP_ID=MMETSP0439-20130205/5960_1 /TAXON_ID=0 /ORGANISM="Stereomyxa ramosa, Strain Chinc5" /LENGTH=431 /DNA_ID=CAMNT_0015339513 /DNA_START=39 /DNA_END=1330 /DNA_ORIENTATION=-
MDILQLPPEVIFHIFNFLSAHPKTLYSLRLTNRYLGGIAQTDVLWRESFFLIWGTGNPHFLQHICNNIFLDFDKKQAERKGKERESGDGEEQERRSNEEVELWQELAWPEGSGGGGGLGDGCAVSWWLLCRQALAVVSCFNSHPDWVVSQVLSVSLAAQENSIDCHTDNNNECAMNADKDGVCCEAKDSGTMKNNNDTVNNDNNDDDNNDDDNSKQQPQQIQKTNNPNNNNSKQPQQNQKTNNNDDGDNKQQPQQNQKTNKTKRRKLRKLSREKKLELCERMVTEQAKFLGQTKGLDVVMVSYCINSIFRQLSSDSFLSLRISFIKSFFASFFHFHDIPFLDALRAILKMIRISSFPMEARLISDILEEAGKVLYESIEEQVFNSSDSVYVLLYSSLLLNADLHNPCVSMKMTERQFILGNRGINEGEDIP